MLGVTPYAEISYANVAVTICSYVMGKPECSFYKRLNGDNQTVVADLLGGFHRENTYVRSYINENLSRPEKMLQVTELRLERISEDINSPAAIACSVVSFYDGSIL